MTIALRTRTSLENLITAWVKLVWPTRTAIVGWPGAPRPTTFPYVEFLLSAVTTIGHDEHLEIDASGYQEIRGDRLLHFSVNAFGAGALDMIRALSNSIWMQSVAAVLLAGGLAPQPPGPINDLTKFLESQAEERAHVDMTFGIKDCYLDLVGWIEHVNAAGVITADTGTSIAISFAADLT